MEDVEDKARKNVCKSQTQEAGWETVVPWCLQRVRACPYER